MQKSCFFTNCKTVVKKLLFSEIYFCKRAVFYNLFFYIFVRELPFYVKPCFFTHINFREKRVSCSSFRPFDKPIYRRQAVFYNMVRTLLNCSFRALLKLYVIRYPASHVHVPVSTLQEALQQWRRDVLRRFFVDLINFLSGIN